MTTITAPSILLCLSVAIASTFAHLSSEAYGKHDHQSRELQLSFLQQLFSEEDIKCQDIEPQRNFNLEEYVSAPWFVQKQRTVFYLDKDRFFCTEAQYSLDNVSSFSRFFGWEVSVNNYDENEAGEGRGGVEFNDGGGLCARQVDDQYPSKLAVSPCFLVPALFWSLFGPYWIMAFDNDAGWAVITGGRPSIWTGSGCKNEVDSGLWIFTREQTGEAAANATLTALDAARSKGLDVDNLDDFLDVDQTSCNREL